MLIWTHSILTIVCFIGQSDRIKALSLKYAMTFAGMLLYIFVILVVAKLNFYTPTPYNSTNLDMGAVITWLRIEILVWFSIIFSNIAFLALRSCFKHKIDIDLLMDDRVKLPTIDTLVALTTVANTFHSDLVPGLVTSVLCFTPGSHQKGEDYL